MAVIVVGGSSKGVGKTTLVCGLIAALPEFAWIAVKITNHAHGQPEPVWEETTPGQETDTARFLAAGARRAFLFAAGDRELSVERFENLAKLDPGSHIIFESNRILNHLRPDLCLALTADLKLEGKPSFRMIAHQMHAQVALADHNYVDFGAKPFFHLTALDRISPEMRNWLREHLAHL